MKFKKLLFLIFLPAFVKAQNLNITNIDAVAHQLLKNIRALNTEQIVLQTNKKIYSSKENIWFKAFEIDSATGRFVNTSKILFADLVDENDKVIHRLMLNVSAGQQDGAFLSDSSLSGLYWIRAYTKNIFDHNINNIAVKPIYILNSNATTTHHTNEIKTVSSDNTSPLTIYPEGNYLISGASSLVAVKLTDAEGKPVSDSILVKNSNNEVVAKFSTNENGLGKFSFEPSAYKKYAVYVLKNNHYDSAAALPAVNRFAAQIAVTEQTNQSIKARVLLEDSIYTKDYKTFLIALHKDSICIAAEGNGNYEFDIPVANFPPGMSTILLYNTNGELVSERNVYINKNDINIAVQTDKTNYAEREKVNINILLTDNKNRPVRAALTVSVNDNRVSDSINNFNADALANLSPNDANLVMLTQTKQNISYWDNLYNLQQNTDISDNNNLEISGVLLTKKNEPASNKSLLLMSNSNFFQDTTTKAGKFSFELASFNTGTPFNMQINGEQNAQDNYYVVLDSPYHFNFKTPQSLKENFSAAQMQNIKKTETFYMNSVLDGKNWLPTVTVRNNPYAKQTNALPDAVITKEMLHSGNTNNVADAVLRYSKLHVIGGFLMAGGPNGFAPSFSDEPEVILDGSALRSGNATSSILDLLKTISTSSVDHIRILTGTSAAGYGLQPGTGVIEIFSANNSTFQNSTSVFKTIYPKGFDTIPQFEAPDYDDKKIKNSKIDDSRTAIYWNSDIVTDESGKANVSFFTADPVATYIVTISGITANGDKIYKTITIGRK